MEPSFGSEEHRISQESSWGSSGRRPKPSPLQAENLDVSRESGLHSSKGTFGVSARFSSKIVGKCQHSPNKREYYARNQIVKLPQEMGLSCSFGVGTRPGVERNGGPPANVGPGSYDIVSSCCRRKSPLDGSEYCSTSMHHSLPSTLLPVDMCSPGPHHKYEVRKSLVHDRPTFNVELLSHGSRHRHPEDGEGPGLKNNDIYHMSVARNASCPSLTGLGPSAAGAEARGTKRCLKSTFGTAERFRPSKSASGPAGDIDVGMSYTSPLGNGKAPSGLDYLSRSRSCSFGMGSKTDFANPYRGHLSTVSPTTYSPQISPVKRSSALDGFASRCASPVMAGCRAGRGAPLGLGQGQGRARSQGLSASLSPSQAGAVNTAIASPGAPRSGEAPAASAPASTPPPATAC